jgi:DNA repair exonuclease SbcCD ATPase subunit
MKELRCRNVTVELRNIQTEPIESTSAIQKTESDGQLELEELSPKATLDAYIRAEVSSGGLSSAAAESRLNIGHAVLSELCDDSSQHDAVDYSRRKNPVAIELDSVSIAGFGSFRKEVHYPLNKRGIVLLRGTNKDFGSDSNGVGKSTLAMASLWALIGSLDSRPVQDGRVVDIVNDLSKMAEVTLRGSLDSKAFVIKRTKNMSSGSSLSFALDGTDLTLQAASDTQKLINEKFAEEPQLLMRSIFHGQHSIGTLLESSDAKLKEELSSLISLDVWQKSASLVRSKHRDMQRKVSEIDGMLSIRRRDVERASEKRASAEHELNRRKTAVDEERTLLSEQETALTALESSHLEDAITNLQTELRKSNDAIAALEHELYDMTAVDNTRIASLRSKLEEAVSTEQLLLNDLQRSANNYDAKKAQLVSLENQINTTRSDWNFGASKTVAAARSICKTCGQPISSEETVEFLRRSAMNKIDALISQIQSVSQEVATAELSKINAAEAVSTISKDVHAYRINLQREEASLASRSQDLRDKLKAERLSQSNKSTEYARLIKQSQQISQSKLSLSDLQSKLHRLNDALKAANDTYKACCADLDSIQQTITDMERDKETMTKEASSYASLTDIFGTKGIQTFVLRNIVKALEYYSQSYLDELSDGSLQLVFEVGQNDNIVKQAKVLNGDGCTWRTRSLSSLSGGQWRRCSLALSLGFVDLASHRGKLRSNLLVLDEPLTHLDSSGRDSVGKLLRKMLGNNNDGGGQVLGGIGLSTILVILQDIAAEEIEEYFDYIDEVVKCDGESYVVLDQAFNR